MFDELGRELGRLGRTMKVKVPIESDDEEYLDKECPSEECCKQFKVYSDDWENKISEERVYCPFCRHCEQADHWWTTEQVERGQKEARAHGVAQVQRAIHTGLKRDARKWNRRQPRNSLLQLKMSVPSHAPVVPRPRPIAANEPLRFKIVCSRCECRYAVVGCAFFCPACGHNDATMMFDQALKGIRESLDSLASIERTDLDADAMESVRRTIVEGGLQNTVAAFQRYAESLYEGLRNAPRARQNIFQNISGGDKTWLSATGKRYLDYLTEVELGTLKLAFQRRHLLAHRQGLVDEKYIGRSGDDSYLPGQRLSLRSAFVRECVGLVEKLAMGMQESATDCARPPHD